MSKQPITVDVTPTWLGILPLLITLLEAGSVDGKAEAMKELYRMAKLADEHVAYLKSKEPEQ